MVKRSALVVAICGTVLVLTACGSNGSDNTSSSSAVTSTAGASASPSAASTGASGTSSSARSTATPSTQSGASGSASSSAGRVDAAAAAYCVQVGGEVQPRAAYWGTNGDQADWLPLAGATDVCRFQTEDEAKSRIYVDLTTLSSPEPTLAALAYLSKVPMPSVTGGANPATGYCSKELGGSSTFGAVGASGGGWVDKTDPDDIVVSLCVFPDQSFIDEWGLAYHSNGEIRGKDLTTVMKYQPGDELPPVYPAGSAAPTS